MELILQDFSPCLFMHFMALILVNLQMRLSVTLALQGQAMHLPMVCPLVPLCKTITQDTQKHLPREHERYQANKLTSNPKTPKQEQLIKSKVTIAFTEVLVGIEKIVRHLSIINFTGKESQNYCSIGKQFLRTFFK